MGDSYKFALDTSDKTTIYYGTSGNDSLDGTANNEAYVNRRRNDTIYSRQGDDVKNQTNINKCKWLKCA